VTRAGSAGINSAGLPTAGAPRWPGNWFHANSLTYGFGGEVEIPQGSRSSAGGSGSDHALSAVGSMP
jgi:hypothetical protein